MQQEKKTPSSTREWSSLRLTSLSEIWGDQMTPEARFSARVKSGLVNCDIERVENRVNLGVPDMMIGVGDRFVLVELKAVTKGLKVGLRPHQIAFMTRHSAKGRPCFILVLQEGGTTLKPAKIHLYRGSDAIDLAAHGLRHPALAVWPSHGMPWGDLYAWLSKQETT